MARPNERHHFAVGRSEAEKFSEYRRKAFFI